MAVLRKRGNVYHIDYRVGGKRIRKKVGKIKSVAEIALKDIEVGIAKKEIGIVERKDIGLESFFDKYLEYSQTNHAPSSQKRFRAIIDNFKYFLNYKYSRIARLHDLRPDIFEEFKSFRRNPPNKVIENADAPFNMKRKAKTKTVNMEIGTLRTIFGLAIKWQYLKENPTKSVNMLKEDDVKPPRFLTLKEAKEILKMANKDMYPILFTFLYTGMRKSELKNLEWKDVDLQRKLIYIRFKTHWKPKAGEREIPIHKNLLKLLIELKNQKHPNSDLVFHTEDGSQVTKLRKKFMCLTKRCGYPDITQIHSLRHTFASHLVMKGVDLATVQKLMGHADIQTTMIYSHLAPEHLVGAVDKLDF